MDWFENLRRGLRRDDLAPAGDRVPFSVSAEETIAWEIPQLIETGERRWELVTGCAQGLEAAWRVQEHPDTRAIECSGTVRNGGREAVNGIRHLRTLDVSFGLADRWGEPFVRTWAGARIPSCFPPDDFRSHDHQLLRIPHVFEPIGVEAHESGFSSASHLPCAVLAGERGDRGLAFFYEWSGLWSMGFKQSGSPAVGPSPSPWPLRVMAGIWGLSVDLLPGEELPLPKLAIVAFDGDLDSGGNALRRYVSRTVAPTLAGEPALPPVSFNHWFGFENDFSADSLKPVAEACAETGVEYFCIDAGWFRGQFRGGIGNWSGPDLAKFPEGFAAFSSWLAARELKFGLWFEPEFAHIESELYRAHPEWFLAGPEISPWTRGFDLYYDDRLELELGLDRDADMLGPRFAMIDFGQAEVKAWWVDRIVEAYERWGLRWLRWDCNQSPRAHWDEQAPTGRLGMNQVKHVLGVYEVQDAILAACPDLFVQQCASGGFRIDLGTVRRGHSFWMSDQTSHSDIVRALQHGLNAVLPGIYADTNLCQGRFDLNDYAYLSHGAGSFGVTGRLHSASRSELERLRVAVDRYKGYRHLLGADYSRPTGNPERRFDHVHVAWSSAGDSVEMEFNRAGHAGEVELRY